MRDTMMTIREETDKKVKEVLLEDQIEEYEAFQEEQMDRMRERWQTSLSSQANPCILQACLIS